MFKKSLYATLFVFLLVTTAFAHGPLPDGTMPTTEELIEGRLKKFPNLYVIKVSASWCPPCKKLKEEVLSRQDIKELLKEFKSGEEVGFIDSDTNRSLARALKVTSIPVMFIIDDSGNVYNRIDGNDIFGNGRTGVNEVKRFLQNPYRNQNKTPLFTYNKPKPTSIEDFDLVFIYSSTYTHPKFLSPIIEDMRKDYNFNQLTKDYKSYQEIELTQTNFHSIQQKYLGKHKIIPSLVILKNGFIYKQIDKDEIFTIKPIIKNNPYFLGVGGPQHIGNRYDLNKELIKEFLTNPENFGQKDEILPTAFYD